MDRLLAANQRHLPRYLERAAEARRHSWWTSALVMWGFAGSRASSAGAQRAASFLARPALASDRQMLWLDDPSAAVVRPHGTSQVEAEFRGTERFTVLRRLGAGGMGVVYAVHDGVRNEAIALKTLRRAQPADVFRLKREFRGLSDVAHPNVVSLAELVVEAEHCFFTMELKWPGHSRSASGHLLRTRA
jgi:hypothetical protein